MARKNKKTNRKSVERIGLAGELFLDGTGEVAVKRAGRGDQLKGIVHEVIHCEKKNIASMLRGAGERCKLTQKSNAVVVDTVTVKNGKVISREQLKDLVSKSGIDKAAKRIRNGEYRSAKIVATTESVEKLAAKAGGKKIHSSGISSKTTTRIADNKGANVRSRNLLASNMTDIGHQAAGSAVTTALLSAAGECIDSYGDYRKGRIGHSQYAGRIARTAGTQAAKSGIKTASALALKEGAKQAAKASGKTALKRVMGSNAVTAVAFGIVEQAADTIAYANGSIDKQTYKKNTARNAGSTGGAIGGAVAGAAVGSIVPVVGTAVGAAIGGMLGSIGGGFGASKLV